VRHNYRGAGVSVNEEWIAQPDTADGHVSDVAMEENVTQQRTSFKHVLLQHFPAGMKDQEISWSGSNQVCLNIKGIQQMGNKQKRAMKNQKARNNSTDQATVKKNY
jgi:hypothetical protein